MFDLKALAGQVLAGLVRTAVPLVVAFLANLGLVKTLGLTDDQLTNAVSLVLGALYWLIVRLLEVYVAPRFGWLLGIARTPVYGTPSADGQAVVVTTLPAKTQP